MASPFIFIAAKRFPDFSQWFNVAGLVVLFIGLLAGSFAQQYW